MRGLRRSRHPAVRGQGDYGSSVGRANFLIEGVSCSGKSTVFSELQRRGYRAINGDIELAYQGDPATGTPVEGHSHENHIWRIDRLSALIQDDDDALAFFCGGSRNVAAFIHLFDAVFVLNIDADTLIRRLDGRPEQEWGSKPAERELVIRLHRTREDTPSGVVIDATRPLSVVVDEILDRARAHEGSRSSQA